MLPGTQDWLCTTMTSTLLHHLQAPSTSTKKDTAAPHPNLSNVQRRTTFCTTCPAPVTDTECERVLEFPASYPVQSALQQHLLPWILSLGSLCAHHKRPLPQRLPPQATCGSWRRTPSPPRSPCASLQEARVPLSHLGYVIFSTLAILIRNFLQSSLYFAVFW
jgi:hypothetical protein